MNDRKNTNVNKDGFERLKQAFNAQGTVAAKPASRQAAIDAAMLAFETQKTSQGEKIFQGNVDEVRRSSQGLISKLTRKMKMNFALPKFSHALAGGVSLAVLAVMVTNSGLLEHYSKQPAVGPGIENGAIDGDENAVMNRKELKKDVAAKEPIAERKNEVVTMAPDALSEAISDAQPATVPSVQLPSIQLAPSAGRNKMLFAPQSNISNARGLQTGLIAADQPAPVYQDQGRDKFSKNTPNPVRLVSEEPVSTFSVDVDTASYSFMRSSLNEGVLPQKDSIRVEEMINYFDYQYDAPSDKSEPFKANVSIMPTPWNPNTKLMRIGIKGFQTPAGETPKANLVFLIDTSGSMNAPNKLPLLRNSFKLLLSTLKPEDTISIVTYAGSAGTALEPTRVADSSKILAALDQLSSGGSTAGAEGIRQAYALAESQIKDGGINRVILATDGDFNVGIDDPEELKGFVERKRQTGVTLSVLGFGRGNYNDELMQALAQNGDGNAAYIDNLNEARKVLVEQAGATLFTIAKDVKLQLEFNPKAVSEYRIIGYETRQLNREDFNNDKVDAGDIGSGHSVTAIYEFTPAGSKAGKLVDDLRYQNAKPETTDADNSEIAFMKIRYKLPNSDTSTLISTPVTSASEVATIGAANDDMRFASAVAAFGQLLSGGQYTGKYGYDDVIALAQSARGEDKNNYRGEFISLVQLAKSAAALEPLK